MDLSDDAHPRVVVECGATVKEANDVLERHGYALPLNVVLESVRFGGLIAVISDHPKRLAQVERPVPCARAARGASPRASPQITAAS